MAYAELTQKSLEVHMIIIGQYSMDRLYISNKSQKQQGDNYSLFVLTNIY